MGLLNAPQQFQQMVDDVLAPVKDVVVVYIDDILIGTRAEPGEDLVEKHDRDVRRVLDVLKCEELVADQRKCRFFVREVEFCGHVLGNGQRRPAPGKLKALEKLEAPRNITELRGFLGFTNYFALYISGI